MIYQNIHFLYCPLTGLGNHDRGDVWLKKRIQILKQFVIPSLVNQTNPHFYLWISVRPQDKNSKLIYELKNTLDRIRDLSFFITYGGLCFLDDKAKYPYAKLLHNLKDTLPELDGRVEEFQEVLMTIQPSDDMYISSAVETIQRAKFEKVAGFREGYIMNLQTKEVAEYNPTTIPPFYTIKFPKEIFIDPKKHLEYTKDFISHEHLEGEILPGRGFVVGTHGANISTTWNISFKGTQLDQDEADKILLETGNYFTDPIKMASDNRVIFRKIINILPFQNILRKLYYKFNLQKHV